MIFGAGLYRFELMLLDEQGPIDAIHRIVEIIDEEGQFGGAPLLLYPPTIRAAPKGEFS